MHVEALVQNLPHHAAKARHRCHSRVPVLGVRTCTWLSESSLVPVSPKASRSRALICGARDVRSVWQQIAAYELVQLDEVLVHEL